MARTRAVDFARKKRAILTSAAAVLAEQGMEKASMAQIAGEAGISKALLYHYYPGKDALIFDILRTHLSELDDALAAADRPDQAPEARLRLLVREVLGRYRDADNEHKVQLNGAASLGPEQDAALRAIERRIVRRFSGVLRQINPEIESERPMLMPVTMSLFGMMNWVYMWFRDDGPVGRDDLADMMTTLLLEGVRAVR